MSRQTNYRIQLPDGSWFSTWAEGIYHFTALVNGKLWTAGLTEHCVSPQFVQQTIKENKQLVINK